MQEKLGKFLAGLTCRKVDAGQHGRTVLRARVESILREYLPELPKPANAYSASALV